MNRHFSAQEFVDALEGSLAADRRDHLASCDACARAVAELADVTGEARFAATVPEPSPLFWEHFSRRVRAATEAEPIMAPRWWDGALRPLVAFSVVAATVAMVVFVYTGRTAQPDAAIGPAVGTVASVSGESVFDDGSLNLIASMASDLSAEELQQVTRPSVDATAAVIEDLTPAQRAEFIRLIKAEIGDPE